MRSKNGLLLGRGIFTILVIVCFGLIIMNEKGGDLFRTKVSKKIITHLETNYANLKDQISLENITYDNNEFLQKVTSKKNKNLFFYIRYKQKEITDTYQKDYEEGSTLFAYLNNKLEKEIKDKTKEECKVHAITSLNNYSEKVQDSILKEENLLQLKYYYIEKEFTIQNWNEKEITKEITAFLTKMRENNITPKYYEITITNGKEITTSIDISNITESFLDSKEKEQVIKDILEEKETNRLKENKITYQYKN